jgi:hypothetical protein
MDLLATCTRFWSNDPLQLAALDAWIERACTYSRLVLVAINEEADGSGAMQHVAQRWVGGRMDNVQVKAIAIRPWGSVTSALNALIYAAIVTPLDGADGGEAYQDFSVSSLRRNDLQWISFQSVEIQMDPSAMQRLLDQMEDDTMVAGAALPGHRLAAMNTDGIPLDGLTCPWNTLDVWHLDTLARVSFLTVTDGIAGTTGIGLEELTTISLLQHLNKGPRLKAKLVAVTGVKWNVEFAGDPERKKRQERKVQSKINRGILQLDAIGLPAGIVSHIL